MKVIAAVLFLGLVCWVALVVYAFRENRSERERLCAITYTLVQQSDLVGSQKRSLLRELPCRDPDRKD